MSPGYLGYIYCKDCIVGLSVAYRDLQTAAAFLIKSSIGKGNSLSRSDSYTLVGEEGQGVCTQVGILGF